jgi:ADP-ribose pyrophosphatase
MKPWKILSSTYLVRAPWAVLRKDRCLMSNGHEVPDYYVLEYPDWVNMVALTEQGEFILVRQYRHAAAEIVLEIPGGVIDEGETPLEAAHRELLEETGYVFDEVKPLSTLFPNPATSNNRTLTYLFTGGRKVQEPHLDPQEELEVLLASPAEVLAWLQGNQFGQALHTAALFYALLHLGYLQERS